MFLVIVLKSERSLFEFPHVGVDVKSGLVHTVAVSTSKVHDAVDGLIRGDELAVFGDKGYANAKLKRTADILWAVKDKQKAT